MSRKEVSSIKDLLARIAKEKKWGPRLKLHNVFDFWENAVGKEIAKVARPLYIRGSVLWVGVTDSIWMQHLHLQKVVLLETINARLKPEKISNIRFELKEIPTNVNYQKAPPKACPEPDKRTRLAIQKATMAVPDPDLRASLKKLFLTLSKNKT